MDIQWGGDMKRIIGSVFVLLMFLAVPGIGWTANFANLEIKNAGFAEKFKFFIEIYIARDTGPDSDEFNLGTSTIKIQFNNSVLSIPDLASALSQPHPLFDDNINYGPMTLTSGAANIVDLNITVLGGGTLLPENEIRLARITFDIDPDEYINETSDFIYHATSSVQAVGAGGVFVIAVPLMAQSMICYPTIGGSPADSVAVSHPYDFTPTAAACTDGAPLTFSTDGVLPAWLDLDAETGRLYGTPAQGDIGTTSDIEIIVMDAYGEEDRLETFSIEVTPCTAPEISGSSTTSLAVGSSYNFAPTVSNGCLPLLFEIANRPTWAEFDENTGALTGTPGAGDVGTFSDIVITVIDDNDDRDSLAPFSIQVTRQSDGGGGCFISTLGP
jgi:hypothetical protein